MSLKISAGLDQHSGFSKGGQDAQVDVSDEESLRKWEEVLHLSREELLSAVKSFGPVVRDIRRGLRAQDNKSAA